MLDATITLTTPGCLPSEWANGADNFLESDAYSSGILLGANGLFNTEPSEPTYRFALPDPQIAAGQRELTGLTVTVYGKGKFGDTADLIISGQNMGSLPVAQEPTTRAFSGSAARSKVTPSGDGATWFLDITVDATDGSDWYDLRDITVTYQYSGISSADLARLDQVIQGKRAIDEFYDLHMDYWQGGVVLSSVAKSMQATLANVGVAAVTGSIPGEWGQAIGALADHAWGYVSPRISEVFSYGALGALSVWNWWHEVAPHAFGSGYTPDSALAVASGKLRDLAGLYEDYLANDGQILGSEIASINSAIASAAEEVEDIWGEWGVGPLLYQMNRVWGNLSTSQQDEAGEAALAYIDALSSLVHYNYQLGSGGSGTRIPSLSYLSEYVQALRLQTFETHTTPWPHLDSSIMAEGMQNAAPWAPINPGNTFDQDNERAQWWGEWVNVYDAMDGKLEWYRPDGMLYGSGAWSISDPSDSGESYWTTYRTGGHIWIADSSAKSYCGLWEVEVSAVNPNTGHEEVFDSKEFWLLESPAITPAISAVLGEDISISITDNTHLKRVTVSWNDGTSHSHTWDDLYDSTFDYTIDMGGVAPDTEVTFTVTAEDTSGNVETHSDALLPDPGSRTYVVNSLADTVASDGVVTLREAIEAANTNVRVGDAPGGSARETDYVTFHLALAGGTITLAGTELAISEDLEIQGLGAAHLAIDANDRSRVFRVNSFASLLVDGLTMIGGNSAGSGGCVYNNGDLTLNNTIVSGNSASDYGGGIYNNGDLTLTNTTVSDNSTSKWGGGIFNYGMLTLTNTMLSRNRAAEVAGGICNNNGYLRLRNSTVSSNWAAEVGGGIDTSGPIAFLSLSNTIVALNEASSGADIRGRFSGNHNLIGVDPGFVRIPSAGADSVWGTADDDHGDLRLLQTSLAVDAGQNALLPADEFDLDGDGNAVEPLPMDLAGDPRIYGGTVDIGAFECLYAPNAIDLLPVSDTGALRDDNITSLNNDGPTRQLAFDVSGTVIGATVTVYADGAAIGSAVADGAVTTVTTNGTRLLTDAGHVITARQREVGFPESGDSVGLTIVVDTLAPEGGLVHPLNATTVSSAVINGSNRYIDVTFTDAAGSGLARNTITDMGEEFELIGAASRDVMINGAAALVSEATYRYLFTGDFVPGQIEVRFLAASWGDIAGNGNALGIGSFEVTYSTIASDFGDAPSPYPTTLASNGARHVAVGPTLGAGRDDEPDGQPSTAAAGDDVAGVPDDEDGVSFGSAIMVGQLGRSLIVNVQNALVGVQLDAWIDFNADGAWGGPFEQIADSLAVANGDNTVSFNVPSWAAPGTTYARFRLSTAGDLSPSGIADDGEVEDYQITLVSPEPSAGAFGQERVVTTDTDGAHSVFAADVDGDGDMDVLSASEENDKIAWYENDGSGGFTTHTISTTADGAESVFAADVDGDGDMDVLSASHYDAKIAWYENDGSQNFTERPISTTAAGARSVFAADVDGDGDMDVLSASVFDDKIAWYENDGSESFTEHTITTTADEAGCVFAADVDGDGDMDVLTASKGDDTVAWYENDGSQNFTAHGIITLADGAGWVLATDVDGDGDMDVLSAWEFDNTIAWHENDGSQAFSTHVITTDALHARSVFVADMDGDGDIDVLSASVVDSKIALYVNDGSQTFTERTISTVAAGAVSVFAADLDGDGDLDVLSASFFDDKIAWYENDASDFGDAPSPYPTTLASNGARHVAVGPTLGAGRDDEPDGQPSTAAAGDDVAGVPDDEDGVSFGSAIMVGQLGRSLIVNVQNALVGVQLDAWIDFNADGAWGGPFEQIADSLAVANGDNTVSFNVPSWAAPGTTYARFRLSTAGDLSPSGIADDGEVEDYQITLVSPEPSAGAFGQERVVTTDTDGAHSVFAADVDGDGDMDVLSASEENDKIAWYENDGSGGFTTHTISTTADGAESVFAADVDGDGDMDVLSASHYDAKIAWYENDGSQNFTERPISTTAAGARSVFAADVDGDGDMDVLSASVFDDKIAWYENDGSESFTEHTITTTADEAGCVFAADVDGDGDMDVLTASKGDDTVAWYENDGSQNFTAHGIITLADGAGWVLATDVDGDGDMDVLSAWEFDNTIAWHENDGSQAFSTHVITTDALHARSVFVADMDGDGDIDVLSASVVDSKIALYVNDGSQTFTERTISTVAAGAVSVFAADLDGDGDLDVLSASFFDDKIAWYENDAEAPTLDLWSNAVGNDGSELVLGIPDDGSFCEPRVGGISTLVLEFSEAVDLSDVSVALTGNNGSGMDLSGIVATVVNRAPDVGEISFSPALPGVARYLVRLDGVTDVAGNTLAGDNDRIMAALTGDINGDGRVSSRDRRELRDAYGSATGGAAYSIFPDLNGDGRISSRDRRILRDNYGTALPAATAAPCSGEMASGSLSPAWARIPSDAEGASDGAVMAAAAGTPVTGQGVREEPLRDAEQAAQQALAQMPLPGPASLQVAAEASSSPAGSGDRKPGTVTEVFVARTASQLELELDVETELVRTL